jgi:hypothetical protein
MLRATRVICAFLFCALAATGLGGNPGEPIRNVEVYREEGRFGGWPANNGIWAWGDEILVGFVQGYHKVQPGHALDGERPRGVRFARSLDGGVTWTVEVPSFLKGDALRGEGDEPPAVDSPGGFDFTHPESAVRLRWSSFYYSSDRGRTWQGPYKLPDFGQPRIMARTDYLVEGKHELTVFLTAAKVDNREGRVFCARTTDGGRTWTLVSQIGPEPNGFSIMPSSVRLSPTRILTTIRRKEGPQHWIDAWATEDDGASWSWLSRPVTSTGASVGNPPSLIALQDGRLALVYGYRSAPYGMRARLSNDRGATWGEEIVLRSDAGGWDLGYPASVQRPDGNIVSVYYYNEDPDGECFIAATIWDPGRDGTVGF